MATTVLLVDDDPIARRMIERLVGSEPRLRGLDLRVIGAGDGDKALALFDAERPDLVITDLFMPGLDGFAFCRELRGRPQGATVPLIIMSGIYKDPGLTASLVEEHRATFLAKPIAAGALADAILAAAGSFGPPSIGAPAAPATVSGRPSSGAVEPPLPLDLPPAPAAVPRSAPAPLPPPVPRPAPEPEATAAGAVAETPVPRLILDHVEAQATGSIVLTRGQMRKEIYLRAGRVVSADSNLRQEALGTLLCAKGIIDEQQLAYLLGETKTRGRKMGEVLVELGWMSPDEVLSCLAAQARKRISDSLRWPDGQWAFLPGDSFGERVIEHDLDIVRVMLTALLRSAAPDALAGRFDADGARPVQLTPRFDRHREAFEAVFGAEARATLSSQPTLGALILGASAETLLAATDALLLTGMAELGPAPAGRSDERPAIDPVDSSFSLERLTSEGSRPHALSALAPIDEIFTEGPHALPPAPPPPEPAAPTEPMLDQESGRVDLWPASKTNPGVGPTTKEVAAYGQARQSNESLRRALLREYLGMHGRTLYDVLGVEPSAAPQEIAQAHEAKSQQFSDEAYAGVDLGADVSKLEAVRAALRRAFKVLSDPQLRQGYDAVHAQAQPAPSDTQAPDPLGAELAFGEGQGLLASGQAKLALGKFEIAVAARPDQAVYHAYLGWALFVVHGRPFAADAMDRLNHALALDPDLAKAHELLGRLAVSQGNDEAARRHLERALELDPVQPEAVELVVEIHARLDDARGAERFYRRLIAVLGDRAAPLRARLWRELATLYERRLSDRSSARVAYHMAAQLAPDDLDVQRKAAELNAEDPGRWREIAQALVAEWQLRPHERAAGIKLIDLLQRAGRHDGAVVAAGALVLRGLADEPTHRLADQGRPAALRRLPGRFDDALARVGYPTESTDLEALVGALVEAGVLAPFSLEDLDLDDRSRIAAGAGPAPFRRVLRYVCEVLATREPEAVYGHPALVADARLADVRPVALLVGPRLLETDDTVELGFRLARAMTLGTTARIAAAARSGGQLRPFFLAALAIARGSSLLDGPEVEAVWRKIMGTDPAVKARVAELGLRLIRGHQSLNLTAWIRSLNRAATRVGLVMSGDLLRVGRAVFEEEGPAALDDLLAFALSLEHLDLREELGSGAV